MNILDTACIIIGILGGLYSLYGLIKSIKEKNFGLDILALTAIFATLLAQEYIASTVVVIMTLTGEAIENYTEKRASKELDLLVKRNPQIAHLITGGNDYKDIEVQNLKIGDTIIVLPGEIVPANSSTLELGTFDESGLTGESIPVEKSVGDEVLSGVSVISKAVKLEVKSLAIDSEYQKIVNLVMNAKEEVPPTVRLASKISIPFTLVSFVIAICSWIISNDFLRFVEVLVLATPCPLLIAAPVAFLGGTSRAAKSGIIVKTASVFETLSKVRVMAFDKTGTLTYGNPTFDRIEKYCDISNDEILSIAASLEKNSAHIIGKNIIIESQKKDLPFIDLSEIHEVTGKGISGKREGEEIRIGNASFVFDNKIHNHNISPLLSNEIAVYVSINRDLKGRIILNDKLRDDSLSTVKSLKREGVEHLTILTGDKQESAQFIGDTLGIRDIRSEMLPAQKLEAVIGLKVGCENSSHKHGKSKVGMVGDGINDAPVLAVSDVGIAIASKGATIASQSADIVLTKDSISLVSRAYAIAKDTISIGKQSMIGGIGLSIILMLIASFGYIPAIGGAMLQEVIDVIAILNGVRAALKK